MSMDILDFNEEVFKNCAITAIKRAKTMNIPLHDEYIKRCLIKEARETAADGEHDRAADLYQSAAVEAATESEKNILLINAELEKMLHNCNKIINIFRTIERNEKTWNI